MRRTRELEPPLSGSIGYPVGFLAAIAVTVTAVAAHGTAHPQWALAALTCTMAVLATSTTLRAALASAAVAWAMHAGFVLGRRGDLVFTPASAFAAAVLFGIVVVAYAVTFAVRYVRVPVEVPAPRKAFRVARHMS